LSTAANNDNVPTFDKIATVSKFAAVHKTTFAQLAQFITETKGIKIVGHCDLHDQG
jgi:hypothetical protein